MKNARSGLTFGELIEVAATLEIPHEPKLKEPKDFRYIGQSFARYDGNDAEQEDVGLELGVG